jgi:CTP:molybdopterin cytidylyltransferase MocA
MSVAAIIVAAGASSRLGQPKQVVIFDGEPLLQRAVQYAISADAKPVFVVLGAHRQAIQAVIDFGSAIVLVNDNWEEGLASSIRAGVKAVDVGAAEPAGVLLLTCDQPRVTAQHLRKMIEQFDSQAGAVLVASVYAGVRGTPAIFPRAMFVDLLALRGDKGARGLLARASLTVVEIELKGGEVDIDRPEDLAQLG